MFAGVLLILSLALVAPLLHRLARDWIGWIAALVPLGAFVYFVQSIGSVARGELPTERYPWVPNFGVDLSFRLDGLSLLFALLITGIGVLVLIYAGGYLKGDPHLGRFYVLISLFMGAMLGLVLADNVITLFVFWELTSISSYLLIGYNHERGGARAAALHALLITGGGGLALLAGLVLVGLIGGSFELSTLLTQGDLIRSSPLYVPTLVLVLVGAFTKSAQMPFHFWLPGAMEAPTPVSAYLHSATMVKAGVYLLLRFTPILGGTNAWFYIVTAVGTITMVMSGYIALYQTDLKRILAYSTVSALGTLVLLIGIGSEEAIKGALVFLFAHALYKGALFMLAGAIDHETGTRDVEQPGGLRRAMPITAVVAALAAISLSGFGPVISFIGKELALEAVLEVEGVGVLLAPAVVLAGALFVTVAAIVGVRPFWGATKSTPTHPHEAPLSMWLGPALLAVAGLVIGLVPNLVEQTLIVPSATATLDTPQELDLYLWHGFNLALILSIVSVVAGLALYVGWEVLRRRTSWAEIAFGYGPARWYSLGLDGINRFARWQTRLLQNGRLRSYLSVTLVTTVGLVGFTLLTRAALIFDAPMLVPYFYEIGLAVVIMLAALVAVRSQSRLGAVTALGVVGYGVALFYILYSAPDLAMTRILVETLTVILFVLVFYHLPAFTSLAESSGRVRHAIIAIASGALMTTLVLVAAATPPASQIAPYYADTSKPIGHGSNIVNVILVDFRGFDTLGEITVLGVAAIGVYALLKLRPKPSIRSKPSAVTDQMQAAGRSDQLATSVGSRDTHLVVPSAGEHE